MNSPTRLNQSSTQTKLEPNLQVNNFNSSNFLGLQTSSNNAQILGTSKFHQKREPLQQMPMSSTVASSTSHCSGFLNDKQDDEENFFSDFQLHYYDDEEEEELLYEDDYHSTHELVDQEGTRHLASDQPLRGATGLRR